MSTAEIDEVTRRALAALIPPPRLRLSDWIEASIRFPEGLSATPGPMRLVADSLGDAGIERVTLVKPTRVGFTSLLTAALGHFAINDPAQCLRTQQTQGGITAMAIAGKHVVVIGWDMAQGDSGHPRLRR